MIDDPQALDAKDARRGIDDGLRVPGFPHRACGARVPQRLSVLAYPREDCLVAADGGARGNLRADTERHARWRIPDLARALDGCDGDFGVGGVGEPAESDGGRVGHWWVVS